jgi:hypothetical protein
MESALLGLLLFAMASVESNFDASAVSPNFRECGILQISEDMVDDCNRIVGEERWNYEDRFDITQSYEMAGVFFEHYCKGYTPEMMARCWNGGPTGCSKDSTIDYGRRVAAIMEAELSKGRRI